MGQLLCLRTKKTAPEGGKTLPSLPEAGQKGEEAGGKKQLVEKANTLSPPAAKKCYYKRHTSGTGGGFPGGAGLEKLLLKIQGPGSESSPATCRQWDRGNLI